MEAQLHLYLDSLIKGIKHLIQYLYFKWGDSIVFLL